MILQSMVNVLKFQTLCSFCSRINVGYHGCNKQNTVRIASREDYDQTDSSVAVNLGLRSLFRSF